MSDDLGHGLEGLADVAALARFLDEHIGGDPLPVTVRKHTAGYSNLTLFIDRGTQRLVMRRPPGGNLLPSAHDVLREWRFISAVYGKARVPRPIAACEDSSVIGAPFYIMERVNGTEIRESIPTAYDHPAGRRRMAEEIIDTLIEIHAVDWRAAGLTSPPGSLAERQLHRWQKQWDLTKVRTRDLPGLDHVSDWLQREMPAELETTIAHGDYKVDNIFFAFEEPRVLAILDWELASMGDPVSDIAWLANTWGERPEDGAEVNPDAPVTTWEGFPSSAELIEMYGARSGRSVANVPYYRVLAMFKGAVIGEGIYMRFIEGNITNPLGARMKESVPQQIQRMQQFIARL